jgi:hypothetical protein
MSIQAVLLPVLVQVALTFVILYWQGYVRVGHTRRGEVKIRDIALGQPNWPEHATKIGNAFMNQFQLPILFYVLVAFALLTRKADLAFVVLSWIFVLSRLVHAYIFVTSNRVSRRFFAFSAGSVTLLVMWVLFAIRILTSD